MSNATAIASTATTATIAASSTVRPLAAPAALTDTTAVTDGRGFEVDDVVELLAELRLLQQLRAA